MGQDVEVEGPSNSVDLLWVTQHERLLTNEQRVIRHIDDYMDCTLCRNGNEMLLHVLKDCMNAYLLQVSVRVGKLFLDFFHQDFQTWFELNLHSTHTGFVNMS